MLRGNETAGRRPSGTDVLAVRGILESKVQGHMGRFLYAAYRVLAEEGHPLTAKELTRIGLDKGYLLTTGKTPIQTMKSKLSTDILNRKSQSEFMRTAEGRFALRQWRDSRYDEYMADRFVKGLMEEDVAVFPAASLSKYIPGPGLHIVALLDGDALLRECRPMQRHLAERDSSVIQLVSVFILRYGDQYLTYKRTKRLPEERLHGFYSIGFGGHLNLPEITTRLFNIFRPDHEAEYLVMRELAEEVRFEPGSLPGIRYKGLLYDDSQQVSRQHLGIVYDVLLKSQEFEIGERGFLMHPKFETLSQIEERLSDFESWSLIIARYERGLMVTG